MLVEGGYLTEEDAAKVGFENFSIGNVSEEDPGTTILLKSKQSWGKPLIVVRKSGDGAIYRSDKEDIGYVPPRNPPFLE